MRWPSSKVSAEGMWALAGNVLTVVAGLATLKIVGTLVSPADYGSASLVLGACALLNGVLLGPVMAVHLRLYFEYRRDGLESWYRQQFRMGLIIVAAGIVVAYVLGATVAHLLGRSLYIEHVAAVAMFLTAQPLFSARANYLEAERRQRELATTNVLNRLSAPAFLLLLLPLVSATDSLIISQGLAAIAVVAFWGRGESHQHLIPGDGGDVRALIRQAFAFGGVFPMIFMMMWLMTTADRYLLDHFMTSHDVGRYTLNYGFWSMPFLILNGWLEVLSRPVIFQAASAKNWSRVAALIVQRSIVGLGLSILGSCVLLYLARPIAGFMFEAHYWISVQFVIIIAAAHCFFVLGYSIAPLFNATKNMQPMFVSTAGAGLINVGLNWMWIPEYGLVGAANATLVSYVLWSSLLGLAAFAQMKRFGAAVRSEG